jgi:hypothetical protein
LWNCEKAPFIQVISLAVDGPIRHSVSDAGAAELPPAEPPPELHPAVAPASASAVPIARAEVLNRTA